MSFLAGTVGLLLTACSADADPDETNGSTGGSEEAPAGDPVDLRMTIWTSNEDHLALFNSIADEYMDSEKVFAVWTAGSPTTLKTYDKINQRCFAHPMAITGQPARADPVNHPWTTGAPNPTYSTEAILWGSFIEQRLDEFPEDRKVRVASLVQNNDFGKLYDVTFRAYLAESPELSERVEYISETVEAAAPTVTDPMTSLASQEPDVYISMLGGAQCTQTVLEAAQNGMKDSAAYLFLGQGPGASLHHPAYYFKDEVATVGASFFARLV